MHPVLALHRPRGRWPVALKASIAVAGRLIGTMLGLGVYALMFCLQFTIEMLVVTNYAAAVVFITPLALTIAGASGHPENPARVVLERGADSLIAVVVALVVLWLTSRASTAVLLARSHNRRVLRASIPVLAELAAGEVSSSMAAQDRRHLYFELLELESGVNRSNADAPA